MAPFPSPEPLLAEEVAGGYVRSTGAVIVRCFRAGNLDPVRCRASLSQDYAPFAWGRTPEEAVEHADVLEYVARLAFRTGLIRSFAGLSGLSDCSIPLYVSEHHYQRKHGPKATYGQS